MEKELALLTCVIQHNELLNGTMWHTFDKSFEIAKAFVEKYPISTVWGEDETEHSMMGDYEETVVQFTEDYIRESEKVTA